MRETDRKESRTLSHWAPALLIAGLCLFHAINNWIWLNKNVMTSGWDRIGSLVNSLFYHQTLSQINLQTLFNATIQDAYRPPLFGLSMAIMYKLFGLSADVAVMVNVVYLIALVVASYGVGMRLGGKRLGIVSAVLVTLVPLVFAMSRYSYFEFSLTALVALSVYLLLASERFQNRRNSILLGLALGLGALIKRTFPVFVLGALVVVFFQAGLLRKIWNRLRSRPRPRWRDVGLAIGAGLLLSVLWYFPNQETAQTLSAGFWLFPIWWVLAAVAIFFVLQPSSPETNFLACAFVGLSVASVWYASHGFEFIKQILWLAWGVQDPRGRTVDFTSLATYTDYLESILYGFSPFYVLLLLLALGLVLLALIRYRQRFLPVRWWDWDWWVIVATVVVSYAILATSIYKEDRAIMPVLPFLAVGLAAALLKLPWRRLRFALIALAIAFGLVQFFAISYTEAHWLVEQTNFSKPVIGQRGLFAQGLYLEVPDSGLNDPDFYIAGDVLQRVEAARLREGWDTISLGILAGSSHVHVGMFTYDQLVRYPDIQLENPVQAHPGESVYSMAFRYDYLVVLSERNRGAAMQEAANLILNERRPQFEQAFELEDTYPLPDNSDAYLFRRRYRPSSLYAASSLGGAADYLHQTVNGGDLVVVSPPDLLIGLLECYWGPAPIMVVGGTGTDPGDLAAAIVQHPRVFVVTSLQSGLEADMAKQLGDYGSPVQDLEFGELRLMLFAASSP